MFSKYLKWANTHRLIFISAIILLFVLSFYSSSGLKLKSSLKELLPDNTPSVVQLNRMLEKVGGISVLTIAVASPDVKANKKFVDDLNEKLEQLPTDKVRYVNAKVDNIRKFYEDNMLHFVDIKDLNKLYKRLKRFVDYEKLKRTPFFIDLEADGESPVTLNIDDIKKRNQKNIKMPLAVYDNYYGGEQGRFLIVMIRPNGSSLAVDDARNLIKQVKGIVSKLNPASYDPHMQVGYCGNVVSTVEEYDTLKHDMFSTAALCIVLVAGIITIYFLRLRLVVFFGFSLILGILITFAITRYAIGYLNAQTAFLASIIIGTGINYGIILIARYLEERKSGIFPIPSMELALETTIKPTFLAAATTAVSFLVLTTAGVKGLSQFGFIGSVGVICCWLVSMLLLPPIVVISEDVLSLSRKKLDVPKRKSAILPEMDKILTHWPIAIVILAVIVASISLGLVVRYVPNFIEYDFSKLRNKVSATTGTEALEKRVSKLWTNSMTPAVVLLDKPEDGPKVCAAVDKQNKAYPKKDRRVGECYTVYDLLPKKQDQRAVLLSKIDNLLDKNWLVELKGDVAQKIQKIKRSLQIKRLSITDLPTDLVQNFKDLNGNVGTFVYINPRAGMLLSDGRNLLQFARTIKDIKLDDGRIFHATGTSLILADVVKVVKEDAPLLTLASFIAVSIFVFISMRKLRESYKIILALAWSVLTMVAIMAIIGLKINFFNFVALPLTFGIGVDYALNVGSRLHRETKRKTMAIIRHTGGAVMLCSSTTIIGYFVLTRSYNQAVAQFGTMAIIGEFTCIFAAILLVPAMVIVEKRLKDKDKSK